MKTSKNNTEKKNVNIKNIKQPTLQSTSYKFDIQDNQNNSNKIYLISLLCIFLAITFMSVSYGITGDEIDANNCGKYALNYFKTFGTDKYILHVPKSIDRDSVFRYYGTFYLITTTIINKISPLNEYTTEHILNSWAGFLMILFSSLIIAKILNKKAAIFCAWILFLSPFVLGHSMNNPKDIPFAASFIAGIYCIILFVNKIDNLKLKDYIFIILAIGISIGTRVAGILLIPFLFSFIFINFIYYKFTLKQKYNLTRFIKPTIIVSVLGYLACSLFWPFAAENPILNPIKSLKVMSNFEVSILQLFQGVKKYPDAFYLPLNLLYTNSIPLILGVVLSIPFIWKFRNNAKAPILYFIIFATVFPVVYIIYKNSVVYHAWRHILFIAPGLAIISTFGWFCLNDYLAKKVNLKVKMLGWIICIIFLLEPLTFIIRTFPNTVTYYNIFVGGTANAYGNFEMDSYGNSVKQEADWFIKNEIPKINPTEHKIIVSNYAHILTQYLKPYKNIEVQYIRFGEKNDRYWDYALFHLVVNMPIEQIKNGSWIPAKPLHITAVFNKPLCVTYKRASLDDMKGLEMLKKNNADSALFYFNNYLLLEPKDINILNNTANIYMSINNPTKANEFIERALKIDNTDAFANYLKGNMLVRQNNNVAGSFYMGKYYFYARNYQEAYKAFNNCLNSEFANQAEQFINQIDEIIKKAEIEQQIQQEKELEKQQNL